MSVIVELKDVTFTYMHSNVPALKNINLKIREGEFIAVIGPLGAGKTTLLRLLNGLIPRLFPGKLEGEISVCGLDPREYEIAEMAKYVGLVLDDPSKQIFNLTVEDDVAFGPINKGLPIDEVIKRTRYAIDVLRLKGLERRHPKELSGGQQQRLALAGVLALRPKIIALDEPISMLDPIGKYEVLEAIKELNRKYGVACIITESGADLEEVISLATRVIVMDKGKILLDDKPAKILESNLLEELGVGMPQVAELFIKLSRKFGIKLPIPVSVEEAVEYLLKYIKDGKITLKKTEKKTKKKVVKNTSMTEEKKHTKNPVLTAINIWYTYPNGVTALKGVSLQLYEGEMVGLIGQNGSGKTTLALNLVGALKPTNPDAKIIIYGKDIREMDDIERIQLINYVFQNPDNQLFSTKVLDEIMFALKMIGMSEKEIERRINEAIDILGLREHINKHIIDLTKDLKTLTALASIYVLKPKILIVDEPTGGLDRKSSHKLMRTLVSLKNKGHTIVIITHDMRLVYEYCDRVIVMRDGEILLDGTPRQVFSKIEILRQTFIKPPQIMELTHDLSKYGFSLNAYTVDEVLELLELKI